MKIAQQSFEVRIDSNTDHSGTGDGWKLSAGVAGRIVDEYQCGV